MGGGEEEEDVSETNGRSMGERERRKWEIEEVTVGRRKGKRESLIYLSGEITQAMGPSSGMHVHARRHIVISVSPPLVADDRESEADGGPGRQRLGQDEHGGWTRSGRRLPARSYRPTGAALTW